MSPFPPNTAPVCFSSYLLATEPLLGKVFAFFALSGCSGDAIRFRGGKERFCCATFPATSAVASSSLDESSSIASIRGTANGDLPNANVACLMPLQLALRHSPSSVQRQDAGSNRSIVHRGMNGASRSDVFLDTALKTLNPILPLWHPPSPRVGHHGLVYAFIHTRQKCWFSAAQQLRSVAHASIARVLASRMETRLVHRRRRIKSGSFPLRSSHTHTHTHTQNKRGVHYE